MHPQPDPRRPPAGLFDFVDLVVSELQRRRLFRKEYPGGTLRNTPGLPRLERRINPGAWDFAKPG